MFASDEAIMKQNSTPLICDDIWMPFTCSFNIMVPLTYVLGCRLWYKLAHTP
jgi:hypothetical protein